jgi:sugar lactone lactonase YvrE
MAAPPRVVLDDLIFPEGPRWHDGHLWFSDMHAHRVVRLLGDGVAETVVEVPNRPSGLGWLPDGRLLVVSMTDRRLLRLDGTQLVEVADLTALAPHHCNDMVVDSKGRAYIGNFGFDLEAGDEPTGTTLVCVEPDGEAWVVVEQLLFPNGMVLTPDERTLIVAESYGQRLSAYDVRDDGSLANPRVWADLRPNVPDGICLDAEGAVWVADPVNRGVMRVKEGTGAVDWVSTGDRRANASVLGGEEGRTMFICPAQSTKRERAIELRAGGIEATEVEVPYAGYVAPEPELDPEPEAA